MQPTGWYNRTYDIDTIIDISVTYVYMHALYYALPAGQEIQWPLNKMHWPVIRQRILTLTKSEVILSEAL